MPRFTARLPARAIWLGCILVGACILLVTHAYAIEPGVQAPPISGRDVNGKEVSLSALLGKVVIIDFMGCWCAPCKQEVPRLNALYLRYRAQGLVVIGVAVDNELESVRQFLKDTPVGFSVIHDRTHRLVRPYAPSRIPSTFVLDKRGTIRYVHGEIGPGNQAKLESEIRQLLR